MAKAITVGGDGSPLRKIEFGPLKYMIDKYRNDDISHVLYRLSYGKMHLYIKGKSLAGSLIILVDTLSSFNPDSDRFKGHIYTHLYQQMLDNPGQRFRIKIIKSVPIGSADGDFYELLKEEQTLLDASRHDPKCLSNQIEAYIPKYNELSGMYGWIPKSAVMNFNRWLNSAERGKLLSLYKR